MAIEDVPDRPNPAAGYIQAPWPVAGLPRVQRHITGHDEKGRSVFLQTDSGAHHKELVDKGALANIIYSTNTHPVELNDNVDIKFQAENEVRLSCFPPVDFLFGYAMLGRILRGGAD